MPRFLSVPSAAPPVFDAARKWTDFLAARVRAPSFFLTAAALAALLVLMRLPYRWTSNEENYFLLAWRWVEPAATGPWSSAFDQSGARFAAYWLLGNAIRLFGFEGAHILSAVAVTVLLAYGLARLGRAFGVAPLPLLAAVAFYALCRQTLMGDEWFLGGNETKSFAYGFVFLALADAVEQRMLRATLWSALAFYLHFQVSGFWFGAVLFLYLLNGGSFRRAGIAILFLIAATAPVTIALWADQRLFAQTPRPAGMPDADYIYAILRNPHHLAPFASEHGWAGRAMLGLGLAAGIAWIVRLLSPGASPVTRRLGVLVSLLMLYAFVAVGLSWIDRADGSLGKLYLFRPLALSLLLALLFVAAQWSRLGSRLARRFPHAAVALPVLILIAYPCIALYRPLVPQDAPLDTPTHAMIAAVRAHTGREQPILLDPDTDAYAGLARLLDRQTVVHWKFMPTNPPEIYRWWGLVQRRNRVFSGRCSALDPAIRFLVATRAHAGRLAPCGQEIWANAEYALIALPPHMSPHGNANGAAQ